MSFIHGVEDHIIHDFDRAKNDIEYELGRAIKIIKDSLDALDDLSDAFDKLKTKDEEDTE